MRNIIPVITLSLMILSSCGQNEEKRTEALIPSTLALASKPDSTLFVQDAYEVAKAGETISVEGLAGGSTPTFNETYAIFTITNRTADKVCCPSCSDVKAAKATIQVKGADGKVLKTSLAGFGGLKEGGKVSVVGTIDPSYQEGMNLLINATGIFVQGE